MRDWSLKLIQCNYFGFCIGAGFSITTPTFKLRYRDDFLYRCISMHFGAMGFQCFINIPLWKEA